MSEMHELRKLMQRLRDPAGGCPWDLEQTFDSIVPHTLEEAYEVADVIESGRRERLPSELGDLLFQVLFYCQLGEESGAFAFEDVTGALARKLVERHPHVFGDAAGDDADDVARRWEAHKARERRDSGDAGRTSELDDVPVNFPSLTRALKLQKRAARVGFDWPDAQGAWRKLDEETAEFRDAAAGDDPVATSEECGDLLFAVVNVARHLGCDPESALRAANRKFERRFRYVEARLGERGHTPETADLETMDRLWDAAKRAGR